MPKSKRRKIRLSQSKSNPTPRKANKSSSLSQKPESKPPKVSASNAAPKPQPNQTPTIPFEPHDYILLVGEGDFSFAASLVTTHGCDNVCATSLESPESIVEKHGEVTLDHITTLEEARQLVIYHTDATKLVAMKKIRGRAQHGGWDRVWFNFPHTGGVTKDVNRQVRANQALLAGFFASAKPLLAPQGTVLVTLFEGEPYTLWNIRDLARHSGLVVRRSWRFDSDVYPGYRHARTIGRVRKGGKGGEVSETAWKGELRPARTYEFGLQGEAQDDKVATEKKRKRDESDGDSDDD